MTVADMLELGKDLAESTREFVQKAMAPFTDRLDRLEQRALVPGPIGEKGEPGTPGEKGEPGRDGKDGADGAVGAPGPAGLPGVNGAVGATGEKGLDGPQGADGAPGRDGRDGQPGVPGPPGEKGLDGKDGAAGTNGRDGTLENLKLAYDGERTVTFTFKNGDPIEGGVIRCPVPIYRGTFTEGKTYEAFDQATWGGHMWMAKETTTVKPDEIGAGARAWVLCVRRGRDGKQGPEGKSGAPGPRGEKGDRGPDRW